MVNMQEELRLFFYNMNNISKKYNKYYHKDKNIFEISLINYDSLNLYIRLDYSKKENLFFIRYLNILDHKFNIKNTNQVTLSNELGGLIVSILQQLTNTELDDTNETNTDLVCFTSNINKKHIEYKFNSFIPLKAIILGDIFYYLFDSMPFKYHSIFAKLIAKINNTDYKYTYKMPFKFDLYREKLDKVFSASTIQKGEECYKLEKVRFLERIQDSYYATVEGENGLYTVIVDYDNKTRTTTLACSCPYEYFCKHMYAVIKSIRNKETYKYYKVRYVEENADMYNKMFSQHYYLCLGIVDDKIIILLPDGSMKRLFVYDKNNNPMFEVVEEDEDHTLSKKIKELG